MKGFGCHMMSVENIIELKGIKKRFEDSFEAVKDFNLQVKRESL